MDCTTKPRTIAALHQDLVDMARFTDVPYCEATIERALTVHADGFMRGSVQLRSTSKAPPRRDLCFRYLDLTSGRHPLAIAERNGDLKSDGHPIFSWLRRIEERFPALGYGADFEVSRGLVKVWHFLDKAHDPRAFAAMTMPSGYRKSLALLRELHLDATTIVGVDYVNRSINLYFRRTHPSHYGAELLVGACQRLGFAAPSEAAGAHAARAECIAFTYAWDAPEIQRICFYVPGFRRDQVVHYDPHLAAYAQRAPAVVEVPHFIVGWSHGRGGAYFKIEDDYTGDVSEIFGAAMHVPKVPFLAEPVTGEQPQLGI